MILLRMKSCNKNERKLSQTSFYVPISFETQQTEQQLYYHDNLAFNELLQQKIETNSITNILIPRTTKKKNEKKVFK